MFKVRNKFEKRIEAFLKKSKVKFTYETEKLPYTITGNYIPDFILITKSGKKIYVETKGHFRPEAIRKMAAIKKQHPDLDIRIVFYSANKKYIRWADKIGYKYSISEIPKDWLDE